MINNDDNNNLTVAGGIIRRWRRPCEHSKRAEGRRNNVRWGAASESAQRRDRGGSAEDGAIELSPWMTGH